MAFVVKASFSHSSTSVFISPTRDVCYGLTFRTSRTIRKEQMCVYFTFSFSTAVVTGLDYITKSAFTGKLDSDLPLQFNCTLFHKSFELPKTSF